MAKEKQEQPKDLTVMRAELYRLQMEWQDFPGSLPNHDIYCLLELAESLNDVIKLFERELQQKFRDIYPQKVTA